MFIDGYCGGVVVGVVVVINQQGTRAEAGAALNPCPRRPPKKLTN